MSSVKDLAKQDEPSTEKSADHSANDSCKTILTAFVDKMQIQRLLTLKLLGTAACWCISVISVCSKQINLLT